MDKKDENIEILKAAIKARWDDAPSAKAKAYINAFFDRSRTETKIVAKVEGNHGTYTVSIKLKGADVTSACSCYIGKSGWCHHCEALAHTFLLDAESFVVVKKKPVQKISTANDVKSYLLQHTLESLLQDLKAGGVSGKEFAEMTGMSPAHLSAIKRSELRNRYFNELGVTKLACLWAIEHLKK